VKVLPSSFRDPSGFLFTRDDVLYRQVDRRHAEHYDLLMTSGLYRALVADGLLVSHEEVNVSLAAGPGAHRVLRPEPIPFVSYPYEWCFGQLKDAALATLAVQRRALEFGMSLRDASAFNVQFRDGRPVLIDTLSFERMPEGEPWVAYRQFCQHFVAPLALAHYCDVRLQQLLRVHIDGIPLDLAVELLPFRARLRVPLLLHLFLHARIQRRHEDAETRTSAPRARRFSSQAFRGLIDGLEAAVRRQRGAAGRSAWSRYYEGDSYEPDAFEHKQHVVTEMLSAADPGVVWDLGANTGVFSRIAARQAATTVSFDLDPAAVEDNYERVRRDGEPGILPLVLDLTNPSPAVGWANAERMALMERGPADLVLALALIHHLAIGNNVPFPLIARFLHSITKWLVIEFVPKDDPKVRTLLRSRADVFAGYTEEGFRTAFAELFDVVRAEPIHRSGRVLYLMRSKPSLRFVGSTPTPSTESLRPVVPA
jgi:hypothetical protein